jgi:hypothetical protein
MPPCQGLDRSSEKYCTYRHTCQGKLGHKDLSRQLEQENSLQKANLEIMQAEVYKQRFADFEQVDALGMHSYDRALVDMLKRGKVLDFQEILGGLGIDPRDSQAVKLVSNQLEELKRFGLIRESAHGWRWL